MSKDVLVDDMIKKNWIDGQSNDPWKLIDEPKERILMGKVNAQVTGF